MKKSSKIMLATAAMAAIGLLSFFETSATIYKGNWRSDSGATCRDGQHVRTDKQDGGFTVWCDISQGGCCWEIVGSELIIHDQVMAPTPIVGDNIFNVPDPEDPKPTE